MHKTPPREDENFNYSHPSYPLQQRKSVVRSSRPIVGYHSDDHPEIPKIRRASLRLDEASRPPSNPSQQLVRPSSTAKMARIKKVGEAEREQDAPDELQAAQKIVVTKRHHPPVYEPPIPARHSSPGRRRRPRSALSVLQDISHNQTAILVASLVLVGVIILPILASVLMNTLHHSASNISVKQGNQTGNKV